MEVPYINMFLGLASTKKQDSLESDVGQHVAWTNMGWTHLYTIQL